MKKLSEMMSLDGQCALVTGGCGRIGYAVCEALMEFGSDVTVLDRDEEVCKKVCDKLNAAGYKGRASAVGADLSLEQEIKQGVNQHMEKNSRLDILIHSAGFMGTTNYPGWIAPLENQALDAWNAAMGVNLSAAFLLVRETAQYLKASNNGSVIFISSIHGNVGVDLSLYKGTDMNPPAGYWASKGGLKQLAVYFASTLAPDIRVNTISPGGVFDNQDKQFVERYNKKTPLGRMAHVDDFKGSTLFLASGMSAYVTGQDIVVDGGYTII